MCILDGETGKPNSLTDFFLITVPAVFLIFGLLLFIMSFLIFIFGGK